MKNLEIAYSDIGQTGVIAQSILNFSTGPKVFAFYGEMGAGKTTIIKEICKKLGSADNFSSPSYSVVNEYHTTTGPGKIYHIDLYRLKNIQEAYDIGIEEYLDSGHYCFIEWPGIIEPLLPVETLKINIKVEDNIRNVSIFMV